MWREDAAQEIRIAVWRAGVVERTTPWRVVVRRTAIDTVRRYGPYSRRGVSREAASLDALTEAEQPHGPDVCGIVDRVLAFVAAWRRLRPSDRRVLRDRLRRSDWSNGHQVRVARARRRLGELAA